MSAGARAEWACEHACPWLPPHGRNLSTRMLPSAVIYADSKGGGNQICWGYEVCAGGYTYDGKCDGTYRHISDGARVPSGDVAIERGRISKHVLQQHTGHERRRTVGVGVRVCPWLPPHGRNLCTRMLPSAVYADSKGGGNQICWGYEVCAGRRGIHMAASAMARTYIVVTELVSHPEMLPLNLIAPSNIYCSNARYLSAGARAECACEFMPAAPSSRAKAQHPHDFLGPRRYTRTRKAEGIKAVWDTRCAPAAGGYI